jgi:anti-anti-sigma factor
MSQENVELLYRAYDAFNRRDLDAFLALMDPEVELTTRIIELEGPPTTAATTVSVNGGGPCSASSPDFTIETIDVRDLGDSLIVAVRVRGHGVEGGPGIGQSGAGYCPRAMLNFDLETETKGSSALVRIRGDLDLQVVERVTDALTRVESDEPELLVIDLSHLSFMDSTGMAAIAAASIRAGEAGRRFAIVMPPGGVRQAIEITGLEEVITTTDDLTSIYP